MAYLIRVPILVALLLVTSHSHAQLFKPELRVPNAESISAARGMAEKLFANLDKEDTEAIAKWIVDAVSYTASDGEKLRQLAEFKSKLDLVLVSPPANAYGKIDGYDLIDESYVPGTDRYFRLIYISYHEGSPRYGN